MVTALPDVNYFRPGGKLHYKYSM